MSEGVCVCVYTYTTSFFSFFKNLLIFWLCWVFVAARGLLLSCGEQRLLFVAVHRLLIAVASLVAEHRLEACGFQ